MFYKEITESAFIDALVNDNNANFSREGAKQVYEYETELTDGELREFDGVALRCAYSEYDELETLLNDFDCEDLQELENSDNIYWELSNGAYLIVNE